MSDPVIILDLNTPVTLGGYDVGIWQAYGVVATFIGSVATLMTVAFMYFQHRQGMRPVFLMDNHDVSLKFEVVSSFDLVVNEQSWGSDYNVIEAGQLSFKFTNVGAGAAKNIRFEWLIDFDRFVERIDARIEEIGDETRVKAEGGGMWLTKGRNGYRHLFDLSLATKGSVLIKSFDSVVILSPYGLGRVVSILYYLEGYKFSIQSERWSHPFIKLKVKYTDAFGVEYCDLFGIKFSPKVPDYRIPSTDDYEVFDYLVTGDFENGGWRAIWRAIRKKFKKEYTMAESAMREYEKWEKLDKSRK